MTNSFFSVSKLKTSAVPFVDDSTAPSVPKDSKASSSVPKTEANSKPKIPHKHGGTAKRSVKKTKVS